jgi:hypothetical protein
MFSLDVIKEMNKTGLVNEASGVIYHGSSAYTHSSLKTLITRWTALSMAAICENDTLLYKESYDRIKLYTELQDKLINKIKGLYDDETQKINKE